MDGDVNGEELMRLDLRTELEVATKPSPVIGSDWLKLLRFKV